MIQKLERVLLFSIIFFLPVQLGKHFWPAFSYVEGLRIDYLSPTLYFTDILIGLLFIVWFFCHPEFISGSHKMLKRVQHDSLKKVFWEKWLLVVLVIFIILGIVSSLSPLAGWYKFLKIVEFSFLGFYAATKLKIKKDLPLILVLLSIGVAFESILAIAQFIQKSSLGGPLWFLGERMFSGQTPGIANANIDGRLILRPYATFSHPNVLAGYLVIAMTFLLFDFKKIFSGVILVLGTIALLLTLSRVAIVLWAVIAVLWLTAYFKKKRVIGLLVVLVCIGSILLTPLSSRFTSLVDSDRETITRRQELNMAAVEMFKKSPVVGVGLNNFLVNLPEYQKPTSGPARNALHSNAGGPLWMQPAHNIYLLILAETGIVGFVFFLWFLRKTYIMIKDKGLRIKKKNKKVSLIVYHSSFIIVLALGFFDHYLFTQQQGQLLLALTAGLLWCQDS